MLVVLDSNPIIGLSKGGVFELLPRAFQHIHIPKPIWEEVVALGRGRPGQAETQAGRDAGWILITTTSVPLAFQQRYRLTGNDAHVAKLAADLAADSVLTMTRFYAAHFKNWGWAWREQRRSLVRSSKSG